LQQLVIQSETADEHPRLRTLQSFDDLTAVFECLPAYFQQQPLLWIHQSSFTRRDTEEFGIELIDLLQKPSPMRVCLPRLCTTWIVVTAYIPTVIRNVRDAVDTMLQQIPKFFGTIGLTRESTAHADDRNRL